MKSKLISFILALCLLIAIPLEARYKYNPFTRKLDYYETGADIDLGDLADITLTGLATGNVLYYDGSAWVNLVTGANTQFLTLAAGMPAWQAIPAGVTTFVGLSDTPATYAGKAGQLVIVNAVPDGLEFFAGSAAGTVIVADGAGGWTKDANFLITSGSASATGGYAANSGGASGETGLDFHSINSTYSTIAQSDAEGIANKSDLRIGLDETTRRLIICDIGDIGLDFGHLDAEFADPTICIYNNDTSSDLIISQLDDGTSLLEATSGLDFRLATWGTASMQKLDTGTQAATFSFKGLDDTKAMIHSSGEGVWMNVRPAVNQSGTASYIGLLVDARETQTGSGTKELLALQVGGTDKFTIDNTGKVTAGTWEGTAIASGYLGAHASAHEVGGGDLVDHDNLTNYVANQHINWTAAASNFSTSEDFFLAWTEAADHATITQTSGTGTEDQALIYIEDARSGSETDEPGEATLVINNTGGIWALYLQGGRHFQNDGTSYFEGDTYQKEDVFISWTDATDHMAIVQANADGTEDQALVHISDARVGATVDEKEEATFRIDAGGAYAFYISDGYAYFADDTTQIEDIFWSWADAADHAVIAQSSVTGIENQALIFIDDDRTGDTANEIGEATIVIDAEGYYALYILDGQSWFATDTHFADQALFNNNMTIAAGQSFFIGGQIAWLLQWDINGAADDLLWLSSTLVDAATETKAWFISDENPNGMTDHDDYLSPTLIITNSQGADTNDYAGVVIGERTQADVKVAHYFDFYAMTGAVDGAVDPNAVELAVIFRFGASGTATPTYATTPGDVLFEGAIEVLGDFSVVMDAALDQIVISQSDTTGTDSQPLIFIDDDRTGTYANEPSEATLQIDGDGVYSLVVVDGYTELNDNLLSRGQAWFYSSMVLEPNLAFYMGGQSGTIWKPTINGAADTIFWWGTGQLVAGDETKAIFFNDLEPDGMTEHDNYVAPTLVIANDEGADANDYAGVVIGERTQADVTIAHYFDFYAMAGAIDGSANPANTELAAIFRFGASGSATPDYATTPGDVLFEGSVEVDGVATHDGFFGFGTAVELTIDGAGAVAATKGYHTITVNGGTGSGADDLNTISGGSEGQIIVIRATTTGVNDTVTVKDAADNLILAGDFVMDSVTDTLTLIHRGDLWLEISRSDNA